MSVYQRLEELGLELPQAPAPVASYVPWACVGNLVFISGQIPIAEGHVLCVGSVPAEVQPEKAKIAARMCGLNVLAALDAATDGGLDRVRQVVRLGVFVASSPDFGDQHLIANGASDLMTEVFGMEIGRHARAAVGAPSLPLRAAVEVEGLFEVE